MSTVTRSRSRSTNSSQLPERKATSGNNMAVFAAACAEFEMHAYGSGEVLYDLIKSFGEVSASNTLDTAYQSFDEAKLALEPGDAGFSFSEEYNRFSLAMRLSDGGIAFAGLLHDQNGTPRVDEPLQLCWVRARKDFELEGETIITKGQEFIKALPESYITKLKKAA